MRFRHRTEYYGYAPDNKRIYRLKADGVTEELTLYGARAWGQHPSSEQIQVCSREHPNGI